MRVLIIIVFLIALFVVTRYIEETRHTKEDSSKRYDAPSSQVADFRWKHRESISAWIPVFNAREKKKGNPICEKFWFTDSSTDVVLMLTDGTQVRGHFNFAEEKPGEYRVTSFISNAGCRYGGVPVKKTPTSKYVEAMVGLLATINFAEAVESLRLSLIDVGEAQVNLCKLLGESEEEYMEEYPEKRLQKAWGDALLKILEGAAEKAEIGLNPWEYRLIAPESPVIS